MFVSLGADIYANAAHVSLLSGVLPLPNRPNVFQLKLILMGKHEHTQIGTEAEMRALHARVKNALDQLGP